MISQRKKTLTKQGGLVSVTFLLGKDPISSAGTFNTTTIKGGTQDGYLHYE